MDVSKLRIKYGEHEFEAEGTPETLRQSFELFRNLVVPHQKPEAMTINPQSPESLLRKVVKLQGRIVSVAIPTKVEDAVLLILLGQKQVRSNERTSGTEIMRGLRASGIRIPRADYLLLKHAEGGNVTVSGTGRRRRYSLTRSGFERSQEIARELGPFVKS